MVAYGSQCHHYDVTRQFLSLRYVEYSATEAFRSSETLSSGLNKFEDSFPDGIEDIAILSILYITLGDFKITLETAINDFV